MSLATISQTVWTWTPTRTLDVGGAATPTTRAQLIAQAVWTRSGRTLLTTPLAGPVRHWRKSRRMARRLLPIGQLLVNIIPATFSNASPYELDEYIGTLQANGGTSPYTWTIKRQLLSS